MKKLLLLAVPALMIAAVSCTKDQQEEVKKPAQQSWFLNSNTYPITSMITNDTFNRVTCTDHKSGAVVFYFYKLPKQDGVYTIRAKADEQDEISLYAVDSATKVVYASMEDDGHDKEQYARVSINGGRISIAFEDVWLKDMYSPNMAKVAVNFSQ
jgi:hypothetical protein